MRKLALAALLAAMAVAPFAAQADDIPDGADCNSTAASGAFTNTDEPDRGAVCVNVEGTTVLYVGGEAQAEEPENQGSGGACGAVIVADQTLTGDPDWDNAGADGEAGTADDEHCD
ncbi:MAG TPA: hypothetical protein VGB52_02205 [Actinomycetota bacterium]|jgi:hypothetical protein